MVGTTETPNLIAEIDEALLERASGLAKYSDKWKILATTSRNLISKVQSLREQRVTSGQIPEEVEFDLGALSGDVVDPMLHRVGALGPGETLIDLRRDQSRIKGSLWQLRFPITRFGEGCYASLVGHNGTSFGSYDVRVKIPSAGVEDILRTAPQSSLFADK